MASAIGWNVTFSSPETKQSALLLGMEGIHGYSCNKPFWQLQNLANAKYDWVPCHCWYCAINSFLLFTPNKTVQKEKKLWQVFLLESEKLKLLQKYKIKKLLVFYTPLSHDSHDKNEKFQPRSCLFWGELIINCFLHHDVMT